MAKIHKTMRGVTVNMDTLRIRNEKEVAVGNMNVNAGGDILGPGGKIINVFAMEIHYTRWFRAKSLLARTKMM